MVKTVRVSFDDDVFKELDGERGDRTWKEVIVDGVKAGDSDD